MWRAALAVFAFAACGRLGFAPSGDSAVDDIAPGEALTTYRDVVMADAPAGYWRLNDTGVTALDETGRYPGTYEGTCGRNVAGALTGDADGATAFDGATCLISLADVLGFPGTAPFTIESWVRFARTDTFQVVFMKETRTGQDPMDGYALVLGPPGLYFERIVNTSGNTTTPTPVTTGRFLHLVATYDGVRIALYMDAMLTAPSRLAQEVMPAITAEATIGAIFDGFTFVMGTMDEIAIYDHALSADRIAVHYDLAIHGPR